MSQSSFARGLHLKIHLGSATTKTSQHRGSDTDNRLERQSLGVGASMEDLLPGEGGQFDIPRVA